MEKDTTNLTRNFRRRIDKVSDANYQGLNFEEVNQGSNLSSGGHTPHY